MGAATLQMALGRLRRCAAGLCWRAPLLPRNGCMWALSRHGATDGAAHCVCCLLEAPATDPWVAASLILRCYPLPLPCAAHARCLQKRRLKRRGNSAV